MPDVRGGTSVSGRRIRDLVREVAGALEPDDALRTLTEMREELDEYERQQVAWALSAGRSYADVARALGITRQAAYRRFKDLMPRRRRRRERVPASAQVRLVLRYARAEALAVLAPTVHPDHVLLGILRNGDRRAAAALHAAGVTLPNARVCARSRGPEGIDLTRAALARALQRAREERAPQLGVDHLLRGALAELDGDSGSLLRSLDVSPADVIVALDRATVPAETPAAPGTSADEPLLRRR
jgi:ATP-dependent Clp protease ATP-binding subunit ClpA